MRIPLDQLEAHPGNANVTPEAVLAKLQAHIRDTGRYPRLIVRSLPGHSDPPRYQILDGHHRAIVLRRLGRSEAECDVWTDVDDRRAAMLLLTLNRLHGEDDPHKRGDLLAALAHEIDVEHLARLLPDDVERIERLIALTVPPPESIAPPIEIEALPEALTFFLDAAERRNVLERLRQVDAADRNRALVLALQCENDRSSAASETAAAAPVIAQEKTPLQRGAFGDWS